MQKSIHCCFTQEILLTALLLLSKGNTVALPLVLASTSEYRKAILEKLAHPFTCANPNIDETAHEKELPESLVQRLATQKARACAVEYPNALIIGSDQVCVINHRIVGKPLTAEKAHEQLQQASDQAITFYTGLCLLNTQTQKAHTICETFTVHFKPLTTEQIRYYVTIEQPLYCAGSFKSEGLGIALFDRLEGRDPNTLIGLPLIALCELLQQEGLDILAAK